MTDEPQTRRRSARRRAETRAAYGFLSPWLLGFFLFTAGPMIASLVLSFTRYDLINPPEYAGLDNYRELAQDPRVRHALWNTFFYTVLHVPLQIVIALGLAMLVRRAGRASRVFRTVFYTPVVTPPVALGAMFLLLLNGQTGLINDALRKLGIDGPQWTTDPNWIKPGIVVMSLWGVGATMILYLAALGDVPRDLLEAAKLDGANAWQRFWHVTLPMISGTIYFTVVVNTIASLQMFTEVYTMFYGTTSTTAAADADAALFYVVYLFQQGFQQLHMGFASAMAWLLFAVIIVVTAIQVRVSKRFVYYEGGRR